MKSLPSISFGAPSIPVSFTFQDCDGEDHYLWGHLCQCGRDDHNLWVGINSEDPDLILRSLDEICAFHSWLSSLPVDPHLNSAMSQRIFDIAPELKGEYKDSEHLIIPCMVGMVDGVKVYALTASVEHPSEISAFSRWPCTASRSLAAAMQPLIDAMVKGTIDLRPRSNPLDEEEDA